jgi:hypothetical protein
MKKVPLVITLVTAYLIFYQLTPHIGISDDIIIGMFLISPFMVISMVYVILKYGEPSKHTFDERFYDDWDYTRNGKEEVEN